MSLVEISLLVRLLEPWETSCVCERRHYELWFGIGTLVDVVYSVAGIANGIFTIRIILVIREVVDIRLVEVLMYIQVRLFLKSLWWRLASTLALFHTAVSVRILLFFLLIIIVPVLLTILLLFHLCLHIICLLHPLFNCLGSSLIDL